MQFCAHDVAVACCLAMAEVWVRLPLGALRDGAQLVARQVHTLEVDGSSPSPATLHSGGSCVGTGGRLLIA